MITVRKINVTVSGTEEERKNGFQFIRDSQYAQYKGLNKAMSYLATEYYKNGSDLSSNGFKQAKKDLKNTNPIFNDIEFGKGVDSKSAITQKVKQDFTSSIRNGLARGERSITNYKRTFPLMTRGRDVKIYKESEEDDTFKIKWVNKIIFEVILPGKNLKGNKKELETTLTRIMEGEYKLGQCSFYFDKKNKLVLILTIDIPIQEHKKRKPIEGRVLGIDLGIKYPVYMCLNDDIYVRKTLGSVNDFVKIREQMREKKRKLSKELVMTKGGKGRNKKMKALDRIGKKESNFVQTYNHILSKRVVEFAKNNQCEYIHMEALTKDGFDNSVLSKWSYYQLQQYIEYKAARAGIKVRYVDPAYTSQKCSSCGHIDKENRQTQEKFVCTECGFGEKFGFKDKTGNFYVNADHNAAINIARGTKFKK